MIRRKIPHGSDYRFGEQTIVLLTVCTRNRKPWLACHEVHTALLRAWRPAAPGWLVGRYVVMPDHLHLFASPLASSCSLEAWVRFWKSHVTRSLPNLAAGWQPGFWDRRLRTGESYDAKWAYVKHNPVRHGLTLTADEWPFAGEVCHLEWRG